ncbi:hypothetical protein HanRHA438_Chr04g0166451 [Helianthus annuus]|nr:hypothetical protein HanHA300_Chr04g0128501 [Helianthus annuus]KAJ0596323.1 hypothetical protein HanHA89_Chr04g0141471 [Helianthus annuus]KAJ0926035.1 hypothetical protein HanRHA438_Chr04g0166451 [Helianthus annuus]
MNYTSTILLDFNSINYINRVRQLQIPNDTKSWLMGFVMTIYESDLAERYEKPMVWIGEYIALASLCCILAMVADLLHGTRSRKLWFPCNYFTINAASLAVIAVAMKLPVDLSGSMPGTVDQVAKLGSVAFMCTMMANLLPCLATMDSKAMLANITALGVLAFTLVVNVCIQIQTGVVSRGHSPIIVVDPRDIQMVYFEIPGIVLEGGYPDPLEVLFGVSYPTIAAIYVTMLLVLLIIHVSSSLAILKSKQIIELKYQKAHEAASTYIQQLNGDMLTVEKLEPYVENYWIMAGSGSPQFIIACSATTTASGVICALTTILHIFTVGWSISEYTFNDCGSAYGKTTQQILIVQFIGVLLGTVAPLSRCFASLSFKVSIESIRNHIKVCKVESYWTQKLSDWKDSCIPFSFRSHKRMVVIKNMKSLILNFSIKLQKGVVVVCKVIALNPFFFMICVLYGLRCLKWLLQLVFCSSGNKTNESKGITYVLQLENEKELAESTLKGLSKSFKQLIRRSEKKQPKNLMNLVKTKTTKGFQGVRMFGNNDHHDQCSSSKVECRDCWSLAVVTLATIVLTLRMIKNMEVDSLLKSVREGLDYVTLVEKNLNATPEYVRIQKVAKRLWEEVDVYHIWLGIKLKDAASHVTTSACQEDATLQIVQFFSRKAKNKISEGVESKNGDAKFTSICANSMSRITETIIGDHNESQKKSFDELISSRIADILAACLTNLPQVIAMGCHTNVIEKREACVKAAAQLLGETKEIVETLQGRSMEVPSLKREDLPFIDKWHAEP